MHLPRFRAVLFGLSLLAGGSAWPWQNLAQADDKLRIICFGAHPDDAEFKAAGVAAKWSALGHKVKFVSVTNGDIGHWRTAGGPLAKRRAGEVREAAKVLGIETQVLDIHDGELEPTLENRRAITRLIRDWKADIVISHRPNDYHPDHRYTGVHFSDRFQKPNPFTADVIVDIDDVWQKKLAAVHSLPSQVFEGGASGSKEFVADVPEDEAGRKAWAEKLHGERNAAVAERFRDALAKWYGDKRAAGVKYAEAFEVCEYGRQPTPAELKKLFPFFGD
jgi:LmbE family N-acetylglucosaminyl deacetylase